LKHYDTMFIVKPTLTEEERTARFEFIKETIVNNGGEIVVEDKDVARELAYKIDKFDRGYYNTLYFKAPAESILELERIYRINEDIIRFIVVKYDKKKDIRTWNKLVENAQNNKK